MLLQVAAVRLRGGAVRAGGRRGDQRAAARAEEVPAGRARTQPVELRARGQDRSLTLLMRCSYYSINSKYTKNDQNAIRYAKNYQNTLKYTKTYQNTIKYTKTT